MDVSTITTLVSTLGFPIVACIYMAKTNQDQINVHRQEMAKVTDALNDLKIVITQLSDKLL